MTLGGEAISEELFKMELIPPTQGATSETDFVLSTAEAVERRYGCKCDTLAHKLTGDGCDECNPKPKRRMIGHVMWWPKPEGR